MAPETLCSGNCRCRPRSQASIVHHQKPVVYNSTSVLDPCWQSGVSCRCCAEWPTCPSSGQPLVRNCTFARREHPLGITLSLWAAPNTALTAWHYEAGRSRMILLMSVYGKCALFTINLLTFHYCVTLAYPIYQQVHPLLPSPLQIANKKQTPLLRFGLSICWACLHAVI